MTHETTDLGDRIITAVLTAPDLSALELALNDLYSEADEHGRPDQQRAAEFLDVCANEVPTFGPNPYEPTAEVWSWDRTHVLVSTSGGFTALQRRDLLTEAQEVAAGLKKQAPSTRDFDEMHAYTKRQMPDQPEPVRDEVTLELLNL